RVLKSPEKTRSLFLFPIMLLWPFLYCSLPNPRNVRFESINMKNVLHWSTPEGTGNGVLYRVKYSVYGVGKWIRKPECRNINRTWCDLSSETSDYEEQYYASVKAFLNGMCSEWVETTRVSSTDRSISIILAVPEKWKRSPEEESISLLKCILACSTSVCSQQKNKEKGNNNTLVVPWLEPGTAYCVSAQIHVTTPLLDSGFSKELHCYIKNKTEDKTITITFGYVMPTMLALLFISVTCYSVHKYINIHKQKHPTNLVWQYTDKCKERVFVPSEKIVLNLITFNGDDYKESHHLSERRSPHYCTVYSDTEEKDLPSKQVLKAKHLLVISHEETSHKEDTLVEGDHTGNWTSHGHSGTQTSLRDKNAGVVEYEHDVRTEEFSAGQKPEEKFSAPRELQGKSQIALEDVVDMETRQPYSPQLEIRVAGEQKTDEFNLKKEGEQTILVDWDPHSGRLYIPTLSSVENEVCEGVFKCDDPENEGSLLRLYEREVNGKSSEDQEMYLLQFKEQWGLHVEMED
uniref:Interleukin 20 receptor subunit alpha n=1 Tax=Malurus cyaneus samueli TaxID=2593467 RepID=A0A8C5TH84_9PASS